MTTASDIHTESDVVILEKVAVEKPKVIKVTPKPKLAKKVKPVSLKK